MGDAGESFRVWRVVVKSRGGWFLIAILILSSLAAPAWSQAAGEWTIDKGTRIILQLNDHLSTRLSKEGDIFTATVVVPIYLKGRLMLPKGSIVTGSISRIQRPGRFRGKAVMNLLFENVRIPGKTPTPIIASMIRVDPEGNAGTGAEGTVKGDGSAARDAATVAKPGIAGTGVGALIGGGKGAAIGGGIGTAVGLATVFATRGKDLEVRRGSTMEIILDRPLPVSPEPDTNALARIR